MAGEAESWLAIRLPAVRRVALARRTRLQLGAKADALKPATASDSSLQTLTQFLETNFSSMCQIKTITD